MFNFKPRWKEIVGGPVGSFILELSMGELKAYLPTEDVWPKVAPDWAIGLWPILKVELEVWCAAENARLEIDPTAGVFTFYKSPRHSSDR